MIVRRVPSAASRRPTASHSVERSTVPAAPQTSSSPSLSASAPAADPVALRSRIDALRGAVFAMREIHDALVGRLQAVRQISSGVALPGTEGQSSDFAVNNAIHDSMRLRAEILRAAAERRDNRGSDDDEADGDDEDDSGDDDALDGAAPPASAAAIAALKRFTKLPSGATDSALCPVCQEPPAAVCGSRWVRLPACRHEYCEDCAVQWLSLSRTCPTCRAEVVTPRRNAALTTEHHTFSHSMTLIETTAATSGSSTTVLSASAATTPQGLAASQSSLSATAARLVALRGLPPSSASLATTKPALDVNSNESTTFTAAPAQRFGSQLERRLAMLRGSTTTSSVATTAIPRALANAAQPQQPKPATVLTASRDGLDLVGGIALRRPLSAQLSSTSGASRFEPLPTRMLTLRRPGSAARAASAESGRSPRAALTTDHPAVGTTTTAAVTVGRPPSASLSGTVSRSFTRPATASRVPMQATNGATRGSADGNPSNHHGGLLVGSRLTLTQRPQSGGPTRRQQLPSPALSAVGIGRPPRSM